MLNTLGLVSELNAGHFQIQLHHLKNHTEYVLMEFNIHFKTQVLTLHYVHLLQTKHI